MSDKITHELMVQRNGNDYIPDDNRSYKDSPLSPYPHLDVQYHIAIPVGDENPNVAITTSQGSFIGVSNTATIEKSENRVFFFPKASMFNDNVKLITKAKLPSLYPTWFIERYGLDKKFSYTQQTPIYYNVTRNQFFIVMDERFLDNFSESEILNKELSEAVNGSIYSGKNGKTYFGIYADTIDELKKELTSESGTLQTLESRYKRHFIKLQDLERVIVLRYEIDNEETTKSTTSKQFNVLKHSKPNNALDFVIRQKMEFELFQAARTKDGYYYLIDSKTNEIKPNDIIHIKDSETSIEFIRKEKDTHYSCTKDGGDTFVIMPYSEDDWDLIVSIQSKLHSLCRELESFLQSSKTGAGELDKPITQIAASSSMPLLTKKN